MRRLDRAMYAICLLALLADVARSQVPLSPGSDCTAGLIVRAAGQFRTEALPDVEVLKRSNAKLKPADVTLLLLTHLLTWPEANWQGGKSGPRTDRYGLAALAAGSPSGSDSGDGFWLPSGEETTALSPRNFEHTGSPAP